MGHNAYRSDGSDASEPGLGGPEFTNIWNEVNFQLEEVLTGVQFQFRQFTVAQLRNGTSECLRIRELGTLSGRCYLIVPSHDCPVMGRDALLLKLNLTRVHKQKMLVHYHHPWGYLGTNEHQWAGPVSSVQVEGEAVSDGNMKKRIVIRNNDDSRTEKEFYQCVSRDIDSFINQQVKQGQRLCRHPAFSSIQSFYGKVEELPNCSNVTDFSLTYPTMFNAIYFSSFQSKCRSPSRETFYDITPKVQNNAMLEAGMAHVYVYYVTTEVIYQEVNLLLDFPTVLSVIGGSIGMFLGWSLLDLSRTALGWMKFML